MLDKIINRNLHIRNSYIAVLDFFFVHLICKSKRDSNSRAFLLFSEISRNLARHLVDSRSQFPRIFPRRRCVKTQNDRAIRDPRDGRATRVRAAAVTCCLHTRRRRECESERESGTTSTSGVQPDAKNGAYVRNNTRAVCGTSVGLHLARASLSVNVKRRTKRIAYLSPSAESPRNSRATTSSYRFPRKILGSER